MTAEVAEGTNTMVVPVGGAGEVSLHLQGFDGQALAAARTLTVDRP